MKEFKGTPGPWTGKDVGICKQDDAGLQLGFIMTFDDKRRAECAANAHLIAAAPELLEALQSIVKEAKNPRGELYELLMVIDSAQTTIAKALGESK